MCAANSLLFSVYYDFINAQKYQETHKDNENQVEFFQIFTLVLLLAFILSYALTHGPIAWIYLPEILTEIAMGLVVGMHWFIVIFLSYLPNLAPKIKYENDKFNSNDLSVFFFIFGG